MGYSLSTTSPFLKGLNTELNKLVDSTEYTNDELNCMIRQNNTRSRRPGLDYEELYKFSNEYLDLSKPDLAFQCIEWTDINSPDESETYTGYPYLVCQVGGKIIFFRNEGAPYSGHQEEYVLDLADYALDATDAYMSERCKFTAAYGCIFITSKAIRPIYLRSAQPPEDPIAPPSSDASGTCDCTIWNSYSGRPNRECYYELQLDGITLATRTLVDDFGSTPEAYTDSPWMSTSTQIAAAWNNLPSAIRRGITATPKYANASPLHTGLIDNNTGTRYVTSTAAEGPNDYIVFNAPEGSGRSLVGTQVGFTYHYYSKQAPTFSGYTTRTKTCTLAGGTSYVYKSQLDLAVRDTTIGAQDYLSIDDNPTKMSYAHLYNLLNQGWTPKLIAEYYNAQTPVKSFPGNNLAQQFLKDKKTDAFKPEDAINMTFGNTPAARGHMVLKYFSQDRKGQSSLVNAFTQLVNEIGGGVSFNNIVDTSWDLDDPTQANDTDAMAQVPVVRPRKIYCADICNYAGRIFYLSGDVLLYSQMIAEDITKADKCYTEADPTSESISDVVETDGGLISLPDIGEGIRLQPCGSSLLVFGTRGNMIISGTVNNIFTATAYSAGAINAVPTQAPDSFVNTEYGVFYWGTTGIQFITQGDQGIQTKDLSTERILTFFGKITNEQHKYCKGIYSSSKKKIYWFYPSDTNMPRRLDLCLVYDIQRDAFTPQQFVSKAPDGSLESVPEVVSGAQLKVPYKSVKEYPVYAELIAPEDTKEFKCMFAESNDTVHIASNYDMSPFVRLTDGKLIPQTSSSVYVIGKHDIPTSIPHDIVVRFKVGKAYDGSTDTLMNLIQSVNRSGSDPYFTILVAGNPDVNSWVVTGAENPSINISIDSNKVYWARFSYYVDVAGTFDTKRTLRIVEEGATPYTFDNIQDHPGWATAASFTYNLGFFISDYPRWSLCVLPAAGTDSFVHLSQSGDKWFGSTYRFREGTDTTIKIYYKSTAYSARAFYDKEMTEDAGQLSNYFNDGHKYFKTAFYDWTRQARGVDKEVVSKPWESVTGIKRPVYMKVADSEDFVNGTVTTAEDFRLSTDIDMGTLTTENGRVQYTAVTLDPDTALDADVYDYTVTYTNILTGNAEIVADDGYKILADEPLDTEEFTYESSILLCLDTKNKKVTFGDFRNNYMRDWAEGDTQGDGYLFDSYMIGHPVNSQDFVRQKSMPYLISYFKRSETGKTTTGEYLYGSKCQGSVRWDWRTDGLNSKWDRPNELYRPDKRTILSQGYIITKTNIRGLGRAFQVKLQGVEDNNFIIEALGFNLQHDERV